MDCSENEILHQYSNLIDSKVSNTDIHKILGFQSNTSSRRQNCVLNTFEVNVGYSKSKINQCSQSNSGLPFEGLDYNCHKILPRHFSVVADWES